MKKYIRVVSDLHLEMFRHPPEQILNNIIPVLETDKESVLILAGDISSKIPQLVSTINICRDRFADVIFIPGNHEFYGHEIKEWEKNFLTSLEDHSNISTLDVKSTVIENVRFIYGILWADGGRKHADYDYVQNSLNDFFVIKNDSKRFRVADMVEWHKSQKNDIKSLLEEKFDGKTVVITHHLPSYRLVSPRFESKDFRFPDMNGGFAANCDDILAYDNAPDLWIHGHTHDTIDTKLWNTRIICNPSGYIHEWNNNYNHYQQKSVVIPFSDL